MFSAEALRRRRYAAPRPRPSPPRALFISACAVIEVWIFGNGSERKMALALLLAATPLGSSQTRCSLIAPESRKPCTLGHSFGCDDGPEPRRMWVNYGCRGDFLCGGRTVHCGATGIYMTTRTGQRRNCTCALRTDADGVHAPPPK